ncbi:sensor histidine kinase [Gordonia rhizosphera]|uniref:Histidine kinase/HSP90-like ATPase domain-containing protein n=1 Tax=Gordonia rhizosphera NBRC 16068 TaxID=1108045 RepID=K6WB98_9ACTN|nr:ATP-binding protein [Gordonia rhizosphera]GAB91041.1 hypothetical protein GORHZ_121_00340 [Gordonia rhizosphera NBRC 16068]
MSSRGRRSPGDATPGETYRVLSRQAERIGLLLLHFVCIAVAAFTFIEPAVPARGLVMSSLMALWSAFRLASRRLGVRWAVADVTVVAIYLLQTPWLVSDTPFITDVSPMLGVSSTAIIAFGIAHPTRWSALAALVTAGAWAIGTLRVPGAADPWTVYSFDFLAVDWLLVAMFRRVVLRAATLTDGMLIASADDEVSRSVAIARHRLARRHCAIMHDTAASTLLMVGQGATTNPDVLARQVDRDLATINAFAAPSPLDDERVDLVERLRELCCHVTTPTRLDGVDELWLAGDIVDAVEGATREALTNVDRHARASSVTVTVTERSVTVTDDGIGFDVGSDGVARRFGVRNSIRGRMSDIGGLARINSRPGSGTTIVLQWATTESSRELDDRVESAQRLLHGFGYGLIAIATVIVGSQAPRAIVGETDYPLAQALLLLVCVVCIAIAGYAVAHPVSSSIIWACCAATIAVIPVQQILLATSSLNSGSDWALGTLGWLIVALTYRFPIARSLTALAALWVIGSASLLILLPDRESVVSIGYGFVAVALLQALALVFTTSLVTAAQTAKTLNDQHVRRWASEAEERALAADTAANYAALSESLVPLLERLRDSVTDPTDPQLRAAALIEGARLRRLFAQSDNTDHPLLQELQPMIGKAEDRGVTVTVDAGTTLPDVPPELRDELLAIASMALAGARSRARIVFTATAETITVSVVCDCPGATRDAIEAGMGIVPAVAGDLTWVELELPLPADVRSVPR